MPVRFTVDAYPNDAFRGKVIQIRMNAQMTSNVVNYMVIIETDNSDGRLLPYMTASVCSRSRNGPACWWFPTRRCGGNQIGVVPRTAGSKKASSHCLWTVAENGSPNRSRSKSAHRRNRDRICGDNVKEGIRVIFGIQTGAAHGTGDGRRRRQQVEHAVHAEVSREGPAQGTGRSSAGLIAEKAAMELIRLENIYKTYHLGEVDVPVLRGISLSIQRGEMVALMGASGSGKTTLMNILGCLDHPTSGKYWLDGEEMSQLAPNQRALVRTEKLGFVFQSFNLLPRTSAFQNVLMPLDYAVHRHSGAQARQLARELLDRVGLADRAHHEPSQMSGGQQQRVAIGRALVNRPTLVLADEPTGNLDSHTSVEILRMFQHLNAEDITVVLVTHDPQVAAYAHRTIHIVDGMIEGDEMNPVNGVGPLPHVGFWQSVSRTDVVQKSGNGSSRHDGAAVATATRPATAVAVAVEVCPPTQTATKLEFEPRTETLESPDDPPAKPWRQITLPALLPATWRTALVALRRNKLRSTLSALGVIIAVAAVIAMTEIGEGSKAILQTKIASMGANMLMIMPGRPPTAASIWAPAAS